MNQSLGFCFDWVFFKCVNDIVILNYSLALTSACSQQLCYLGSRAGDTELWSCDSRSNVGVPAKLGTGLSALQERSGLSGRSSPQRSW